MGLKRGCAGNSNHIMKVNLYTVTSFLYTTISSIITYENALCVVP